MSSSAQPTSSLKARGKRKASTQEDDTRNSSSAKKTKRPKRPEPPQSPPLPPPLQFQISSLVWEGEPMVWDADGNPFEPFGQYARSLAGPGILGPPTWSPDPERQCWVYTPKAPYTFEYWRRRYIGYKGSQITYYGGVFGERQDPLVFIHLKNQRPWVAYICRGDEFEDEHQNEDEDDDDDDGDDEHKPSMFEGKHKVTNPPFEFWTGSGSYGYQEPAWCFQNAESAPFLCIYEPDLELHHRAIETGDGNESDEFQSDPEDEQDSSRFIGWQGDWTREYIRRAEENMPLETLERVIWADVIIPEAEKENGGKRAEGGSVERDILSNAWGVKLSLKPLPDSVEVEEDYYHDESIVGKQRLAGYKIRATILEVYFKPDLFKLRRFKHS